MIDTSIFQPAVAMVALTFAVSVRLLFTRVSAMKRERIHPQSVATAAAMAARMPDSRVADNFRNLFELPVLFYLATVVAAMAGLVTPTLLAIAWAFVALRIAHSVIHCTYNKVMHRFYAYIGGWAALVALWGVLAAGLFAR
ncbi:MAPEG family protein [Cognatilysobacter bugurensis]|uniref:Membrane protein n=1 Tax=Cognatilysobacter bugurensis TaxID=543356 RepID=A0A918SVE0_9GAMM|nr:MAPEG family protein [Lysobacter bugurensis]GHA70757.1 membrane protein [Lysobacter bugurensis]